jgi:hypothetical protein
LAVESQKGAEIGFGNSHGATKPMDDKLAGSDPAANRTCCNAEHFRRLGDREKLNSVVTIAAARAIGNGRFSPTARASPSSPSHFHRTPPRPDGRTASPEWFGSIGGSFSSHARRSCARINVRRPRFTARSAPEFIVSYSAVRPMRAISQTSSTE